MQRINNKFIICKINSTTFFLHFRPVSCSVPIIVNLVNSKVRTELDKDSKWLRGPFLARIELARRLGERGDNVAELTGKIVFTFHIQIQKLIVFTIFR